MSVIEWQRETELKHQNCLLQHANAALAYEVAALRRMGADQARSIRLQAERIELLERLTTPPGKRGLARLQPSPWWRRACRAALARLG